MSKFIEVTKINTDRKIYLLASSIVYIWKTDINDSTTLHLSTGEDLWVNETPEEIFINMYTNKELPYV